MSESPHDFWKAETKAALEALTERAERAEARVEKLLDITVEMAALARELRG